MNKAHPTPSSFVSKTRLPGVLMRLSREGHIKSIGVGARALFGVDLAAAVGKALFTADELPAEMRQALVELMEEIGRQRDGDTNSADAISTDTHDAQFQMIRRGQSSHFRVSAFLEDADNVVVLTQDITEHLNAESMHRDCLVREEHWRQHAEATARARDQFLSVVSHELRSPLNGIQSWAHVLESQIDTDKPIVQRALAGIKTGVTQQVFLIEALLDATQILNGHFSLLEEPYSLNGAIQSAIDELRSEAEQKQIDVVFIPDVADIDMLGDAERIQQVFRHLLSNAIKFTADNGNVNIRVSRSIEAAEVSVEDDGIGIAPTFGASIFEPFRQQDSSQTRRAAGLGLGLAVSRRVAELHGGSLQCESEGVGRGSTFRVILPLIR